MWQMHRQSHDWESGGWRHGRMERRPRGEGFFKLRMSTGVCSGGAVVRISGTKAAWAKRVEIYSITKPVRRSRRQNMSAPLRPPPPWSTRILNGSIVGCSTTIARRTIRSPRLTRRQALDLWTHSEAKAKAKGERVTGKANARADKAMARQATRSGLSDACVTIAMWQVPSLATVLSRVRRGP